MVMEHGKGRHESSATTRAHWSALARRCAQAFNPSPLWGRQWRSGRPSLYFGVSSRGQAVSHSRGWEDKFCFNLSNGSLRRQRWRRWLHRWYAVNFRHIAGLMTSVIVRTMKIQVLAMLSAISVAVLPNAPHAREWRLKPIQQRTSRC